VDAGCRLGEPPSNVGAGRDPVRARQGQVRPERTLVGRPASRHQLAVDGGRERCELPCSVRDRQPQRPRPAWVRERATAVDLDLEGILLGARPADRLRDRAHTFLRGGAEKTQREMQAVHADPANITFARRVPFPIGANPLHEIRHRPQRGLVERHRHEEAALRHALGAPTSCSHASRSARRISRARS